MSRKNKKAEVQAEITPVSGELDFLGHKVAMRHQHKGAEEQIGFLRAELGRLKKQVHDLEAEQRGHRHAQPGEPVIRNGVHIDQAGQYFMRRPDGWHHMPIAARTSTPRGRVWRLREDK